MSNKKKRSNRIFRTLLAFLVISLTLSVPLPAYAQSSGVGKNIAASAYISEDEATLIADSLIDGRISDPESNWDDTTVIEDVVALYDFDGNANRYLFRPSTGGVAKGNIIVDASALSPQVVSFSYDGDAAIDAVMLQAEGRKIESSDLIIAPTDYVYLQEDKDTYQYADLLSGETVTASKSTLKESYSATLTANENEEAISNLENLMAKSEQTGSLQTALYRPSQSSSIMKAEQIVYSDVILSGYTRGTNPGFITSDFGYPGNNCAPTAGMNFLWYWSQLSSRKVPELWYINTSYTYSRIFACMGTDYNGGGTPVRQEYSGINDYANMCGYPRLGSSLIQDSWPFFDAGNCWSWFTINLNNGNMLQFSVEDTQYETHAMVAIGYQECDDGNYLRILDGWTRTTSNFYTYRTTIRDAGYSRW